MVWESRASLLGDGFRRKLGGSFCLGIRRLLRGQRERSGFPARHSGARSLPLFSPSALACCFSTWSAPAAALANATASRGLHAPESLPPPVSPLREPGPYQFRLPLEPPGNPCLLPPVPTPSAPLWEGTPPRRGRGSTAGDERDE